MSDLASIINAFGTLVTALGIAAVGIMTVWQRREISKQGNVLNQVEKQGNSRDLENKRLVAMIARRLADANHDPGDIAVATDAEKVYSTALKQFNETEKEN